MYSFTRKGLWITQNERAEPGQKLQIQLDRDKKTIEKENVKQKDKEQKKKRFKETKKVDECEKKNEVKLLNTICIN